MIRCYFSLFASASGAFLLFSKKMWPKVKQGTQSADAAGVNGRSAAVQQVSYMQQQLLTELLSFPELERSCQILQQWYSLEERSRSKYSRKTSACPEPTLGLFRPDVCFGSVSETFHRIAGRYLQERGRQREDLLDAHRCSLLLLYGSGVGLNSCVEELIT